MQFIGVRTMRITTSNDARATGAAGTDREKRQIELHAVFGKLVDVGRLDEVVRLWVTTNRPMRMIIRVNKQNVRSLFA